MSQYRLTAEALSFTYPDGTPALKNVSLTIGHGEGVAIVGANGAGKSTLLQHFNGVLSPVSGRLTLGDLAVTGRTLAQVRQVVGAVFQDPDDQLFMPTVFDDVAFGPLNLELPEAECRQRVQLSLEQVGAWHLRARPPHRLSGGEKRRVAIAAVLAMSPAILALDEPSAGLDPQSRRQIMGLLQALPHTRIVATHDLEMALELCPRTICLRQGEIAADGETAAVLGDAALMEACGLEVPASLTPCPRCAAAKS
jgi:cobalt/nickel transport system ATP-binding protein